MTIAAAYLTSEGVVLGADSTTSVIQSTADGDKSVVQLLNHAQKVFEVGPPGEGRIGVCTWGAGSFGNTSHRTLVVRLADEVTDDTTIEEAANILTRLVEDEYRRVGQVGDVGYFVGGCNVKTRTPDCWHLWFESGRLNTRQQLAIGDASFSGAPEFFGRVFFGYDSRLKGLLFDEMRKQYQLLTPVSQSFLISLLKTQVSSYALRDSGICQLETR